MSMKVRRRAAAAVAVLAMAAGAAAVFYPVPQASAAPASHVQHVREAPLPAWLTWEQVPPAIRKSERLGKRCILIIGPTSVIMCPSGRVEVS